MSVFVIADLHLSTKEGMNKSMELFGYRWRDYVGRLERNWRAVVKESDTVVIPGDISWAMSLTDTESDFAFLHSLPGKKILGKGNHDLWWESMTKMGKYLAEREFSDITFLYNSAVVAEDFILCGTRGWYQDVNATNMPKNTDYEKLINREVIRLRLSLEEAKKLKEAHPDKEIIAFLHFPPVWADRECLPLVEVLKEYAIRRCYFGHIHGSEGLPLRFESHGISFHLISADTLQFLPQIIGVNTEG